MGREPQTHHEATGSATAEPDYAARLVQLASTSWKRRLDVQKPYRWHIRTLNLGRVIDVGCGIGRNLAHLDGNGIGVDHNESSVAVARTRGFTAYTPAEFHTTAHARPGAFDAMLLSHVVEHVAHDVAVRLIEEYLPYLRSRARVVFICPQEKGWRTDPTHVRFVDLAGLESLATELALRVEHRYSFPFPRPAGLVFPYNEFVLIGRKG